MAKRGQGEGSIFKRTDGRWVGSINLGTVNGQRARKDFYGKTRREVQEKLTSALRDHQLGLPVMRGKDTVAQYLSGWLEDVVKRGVRPETHKSYEQVVRIYIEPWIGNLLLAKLSTTEVRSMVNHLEDTGLSTRTVQYAHAVLRKALNVAVADQLVIRNVAALVKPPRVITKEVQPLPPEEARRFLEAVQGDRLEGLYTVAVSLGLRQGESLGLRWRDIDLEKGSLRVRYALQRLKDGSGTIEIHLVEPKTKQSRRTIDLPNVTRAALISHRERQAEDRTLCGSGWITPEVHCEGHPQRVDDFVFTTTIGTPLEGCNLTKRFQKILKACGIAHHRFHDLRHTAATLLSVQGVHPKGIQAVLGWENMAMVGRYTHFVDELRKDAAAKMDDVLKPVAVSPAVKRPVEKVN